MLLQCVEKAFLDQDAALWAECRHTPQMASSSTCVAVVMVHAGSGRAWSARLGDLRVVVFETARRRLLFETADHTSRWTKRNASTVRAAS